MVIHPLQQLSAERHRAADNNSIPTVPPEEKTPGHSLFEIHLVHQFFKPGLLA
jgi:hypothetical protein